MNFFRLRRDFNAGWEWQAILVKDKQGGEDFELLQSGRPIEKLRLYLTNRQSDLEQRKQAPFSADVIYWTDDITLNAFIPEGTYLIVSNELLDIILKYRLPEHIIYPLEIVNAEDSSRNHSYSLIQLFGWFGDYTDYSKSEYIYMPRRSKYVLKRTIGEFDSYEEYSKAYDKAFFEERIKITISKRVYTDYFDIAWGITNDFIISERLKIAIENNNFKGIELPLFNDYEVIMPSPPA